MRLKVNRKLQLPGGARCSGGATEQNLWIFRRDPTTGDGFKMTAHHTALFLSQNRTRNTHIPSFATMKISTSLVFLSAVCLQQSASAFSVIGQHQSQSRATVSQTARFMFGGAGAGVPSEDNPEELAAMEQAAKSMGMSIDEYKLGIGARLKLTEELDAVRLTAGNSDTVSISRCANNPPKFLEITITDAGKALGKEAVSKELVTALQKASDDSRESRTAAQKSKSN